jgi:hypothetical protein
MSYGHKGNDDFNISIWQQKTKVISKVSTKNSSKTIVTDIENKIDEYFLFEITCYPNGKLVCAINENLKSTEDLKDDIHIIDGKVILGSNLDGTEFGEFQEKCLVIQSIDKSNYTRNLGIYALRKLSLTSQSIPYNLIKRKI